MKSAMRLTGVPCMVVGIFEPGWRTEAAAAGDSAVPWSKSNTFPFLQS